MTIIHTVDICASRYHSGFLDGIHICFLLGLGGCIAYILTQINKNNQEAPVVINVYMNDKNEDEEEEEEEEEEEDEDEEEEEEVEENEVDDVEENEEELPVQEPVQEPIQEQLQNPGVEEQNPPAPLSN